MRRMILAAVVLLGICLYAAAYDLKVVVIDDVLKEKVTCLHLDARYPNLEKICDAELQERDSVYVFRNLPAEMIYVSYQLGKSLYSDKVPEPIDSITIEVPHNKLPISLNDVSVVANSNSITDEKTIYLPSSREKKSSSDAFSLLQRMAIATLSVDDVNGYSIRTVSGEGVATYIDYLPAGENDLKNLRTADVVRVETYDYPADPRFGGAAHVVNFVLVKYEYGGYAKAYATQRFEDNRGSYGVGAKMVYKKMTYDVTGGYDYNRYNHQGMASNTYYDFGGYDVLRTIESPINKTEKRNAYVSLRGVLQSDKSVISNTLSYSLQKSPGAILEMNTSYAPAIYRQSTERETSNSKNDAVAWQGMYQLQMPHNMTMIISPTASYVNNDMLYTYHRPDNDIINDVSEKAWGFGADISMQKQIKGHTVGLLLGGGGQGNDVEYKGTMPADVASRYYYGGGRLSAQLTFGKVWLQGNVGVFYNHTAFGESKRNEVRPKYFVAAGYRVSSKMRMDISSELSYWTIPLSEQSPNVMMLTQIDAVRGDDNLKSYMFNSVNAQYSYFPNQWLSLAAFASYYRQSSPIVHRYEPMEYSETPVMVRTYVNAGNFNSWSYGGSATAKLLKRTLVLKLSVSGNTIDQCQGNDYDDTHLRLEATVAYFWRDFYAQCFYRYKYRGATVTNSYETPHYYNLSLGWGNGNWNVSMRVLNPFNSDWLVEKQAYNYSNYRSEKYQYGNGYHRSFELSVTYSLSYGKKVARTDAPDIVGSVGSAILK